MKIVQCDHCEKQADADPGYGGPKTGTGWTVTKEKYLEFHFCSLPCVADYYNAKAAELEAMRPKPILTFPSGEDAS